MPRQAANRNPPSPSKSRSSQLVRRLVLSARLARTVAATAAASGATGEAVSGYGRSIFAFKEALPGSRPVADTTLLRAAQFAARGDPGAAYYTVRAVEQVDLRNYEVIHFAAHALLPSELRCVDEPAIVTSAAAGAPDVTGALLTATDVTGLKLDADLVILSACNTGGPGQTTGGESLSGLARAFFYAGARSMMVTHWSVNDQATAFLVVDTLRHLRSGQTSGGAASLRLAQLDMLAEAGRAMPAAAAHPYYWASFALIGEGRRKLA